MARPANDGRQLRARAREAGILLPNRPALTLPPAMYRLTTIIPSEGPDCLIPEIAFHPQGQMFAASYLQNDEIRLFNARDAAPVKIFRNPAAELDKPHALLLTQRHLIVANRHQAQRPATLVVYNLEGDSQTPVFKLETPLGHLREGHSMDIHGDILVLTYCHNVNAAGALLSYRFDDDSGEISGPIDHQETCFERLGMAKGVAFSAQGEQVLVTFNADKKLSRLQRLAFKWFKARNIMAKSGLRGLIRHRLAGKNALDHGESFLHNGIAVIDISADGHFAEEPGRVMLRQDFCRLENIALNDTSVALADTINHRVQLYDYARDPDLEQPVHTITEKLCLPHGVKFSPDRQLLVVSNYGLRSYNQLIHWGYFTAPRSDNVLVFERIQGTASEAWSSHPA